MKILLLLLGFTLLSTTSFSQGEIKIRSGSEKFSVGKVDVIIADVYEADVKYIRKSWKKLIKRYSGDVKMKDEIFADDVLIKRLSSNTVDIYTKINEKSEGVAEIICAVDLGGAYLNINSHSEKYKLFEQILKEFVVEVSKEAVREQIAEQEKGLDKLKKEQEDLVSDKEKKEKEIEDYKQKILDNEAAIEQNIKDQELKKKDIETQKALIITLSEKERAIK
jgi:hypothetical protein